MPTENKRSDHSKRRHGGQKIEGSGPAQNTQIYAGISDIGSDSPEYRARALLEDTDGRRSNGLIGAIIMIGYIVLIAAKLAARRSGLPIIGLALMLWGFWGDDWKPAIQALEEIVGTRRALSELISQFLDQPIRRAQQPCIVSG